MFIHLDCPRQLQIKGPCIELQGILLSSEAQKWAQEFRKHINMTGDTGLMGTSMDHDPIPVTVPQWRRVGRARINPPNPITPQIEMQGAEGYEEVLLADTGEADLDREDREHEEQLARLEEEVRIEQEIYDGHFLPFLHLTPLPIPFNSQESKDSILYILLVHETAKFDRLQLCLHCGEQTKFRGSLQTCLFATVIVTYRTV